MERRYPSGQVRPRKDEAPAQVPDNGAARQEKKGAAMENDDMLSRRTFVKGAASAALLLLVGALLTACGGQSETEQLAAEGASEEPAASDASAKTSSEQAAQAGQASGTLVAFFSATGNTRGVAEKVANHLGADLFEIEPAEPYTEADLAYNDPDSRTSRERASYDPAVELVQTTPDGFDGYDTVFLGYPIWWGNASWAVNGFVSGNDFAGKTVIPFCTSGSSSLGQSGQNLAALVGAGEWLAGARFAAGASESEVAAWVDGLGL